MMQDLPETLPIFATKVPREGFRERVANRIRVAKTLAFNDLDRVISNTEI